MHYNLEYDVPCLADVAVNQMLDKDFFVWLYEEGYTEAELEILHKQTIIYNLDGSIKCILGE